MLWSRPRAQHASGHAALTGAEDKQAKYSLHAIMALVALPNELSGRLEDDGTDLNIQRRGTILCGENSGTETAQTVAASTCIEAWESRAEARGASHEGS